eukprot:TRINITY_DN15739_c0_g2_i1.p1 TRINITY_DN15739_c0_g2~~TRINITY_DN15739_c0_g2_i1.p1  ORF type:complete len:174 (-),score=32.01 TRINITY_DN15739_c0_g2_i1:100-621(-)
MCIRDRYQRVDGQTLSTWSGVSEQSLVALTLAVVGAWVSLVVEEATHWIVMPFQAFHRFSTWLGATLGPLVPVLLEGLQRALHWLLQPFGCLRPVVASCCSGGGWLARALVWVSSGTVLLLWRSIVEVTRGFTLWAAHSFASLRASTVTSAAATWSALVAQRHQVQHLSLIHI